MANKTFHIPKSAIVKSEDNVSILEGKQQTITTDASAVATLTNTDGFKAAHYSVAAERDGVAAGKEIKVATGAVGPLGIGNAEAIHQGLAQGRIQITARPNNAGV